MLPFWANQQTTGTHVNVSGAGVTAHAKNRANAVKLLEYLSSPEAQQMFADVAFEYPANPQAGTNPIVAKVGQVQAGRQQRSFRRRVSGGRDAARRPRGLQIGASAT